MRTEEVLEKLTDKDAEMDLLGWALVDGCIPDDLTLEPDDFYFDEPRAAFRIMQKLQQEGQLFDPSTVAIRALSDPEAARITEDWPSFLTHCTNHAAGFLNGKELAEHVRKLCRRRLQLRDANERASEAFDLTRPLRPEFEPVQRILPPRFKVMTAADILRPPPPVEWLVDGLIRRGSLCMFYGDPGCMKTTSTLWLAVCLATGHDWLGRATRKSRVLYIDEELGMLELWRWAHKALRGVLGDESAPLSLISGAGLRLDEPGDRAQLQRMIELDGHEAVFIDTLAAASGGDENSKQEQQPIMTGLRQISERTQAFFGLNHHANKNGGYRGTSAFKASVDLLVKLSSAPDSQFVQFKTEKVRHGPPAAWAGRITRVDGAQQFYMEEAGLPEAQRGNVRPTGRQFVLDYVRENGESTIAEIAEATALTEASVRKAVSEQVRKKLLKRVGDGGGRGRKAVFVAAGRAPLDDTEEALVLRD